MDATLKALFRYSKREACTPTWQEIRDKVLAKIYHHDMSFADVVKVILSAYAKALMEPRFELPGRNNASEDLLLAPIKGHHAIDLMGPSSAEVRYSVEQFYDAMIRKMMGDLQVCRVDWCRDEIFPEEAERTLSTPALHRG